MLKRKPFQAESVHWETNNAKNVCVLDKHWKTLRMREHICRFMFTVIKTTFLLTAQILSHSIMLTDFDDP